MQTLYQPLTICQDVSLSCQVVSLICVMIKLIQIVGELEKLTFEDQCNIEKLVEGLVKSGFPEKPEYEKKAELDLANGITLGEFGPRLDIHRELKNRKGTAHQVIYQNVLILISHLTFFQAVLLGRIVGKLVHPIPRV